MISEKEFIIKFSDIISSEMMLIRAAQHDLLQHRPEERLKNEFDKLEIVYNYLRDRLISQKLHNEKRLH
tara:strand:- start:105 stop:311 length:207 start_codon:yes stop_codon:yes gene_type:complete